MVPGRLYCPGCQGCHTMVRVFSFLRSSLVVFGNGPVKTQATVEGEGIVGEIGSAFLSADCGITDAPCPDHAQYMTGWFELLADNKRTIFQ